MLTYLFCFLSLDDILSKAINGKFSSRYLENQALNVPELKPDDLISALNTIPNSNLIIPTNVPAYVGKAATQSKPTSISFRTGSKNGGNNSNINNYKELEQKYAAAKTPIILKFVQDCFGNGKEWFKHPDYPSRFKGIVYEDIYQYVNKICRLGRSEAKKLYFEVYKVIVTHVDYLGEALVQEAVDINKDWKENESLSAFYSLGKNFLEYYKHLQETINHFNNALSPLDSSLLKKSGKGLAAITVSRLAESFRDSRVIEAFAMCIISYECAGLVKSSLVDPGLIRAVSMRVSMISPLHGEQLFYEVLKNEIRYIQPAFGEELSRLVLKATKENQLVSTTIAKAIEESIAGLINNRPVTSGFKALEQYNALVLEELVKDAQLYLSEDINDHVLHTDAESLSKITKLLISVNLHSRYIERVKESIIARLECICKQEDSEKMIVNLIEFRKFLSDYVDAVGKDAEKGHVGIKSATLLMWDSIVSKEEYENKIAKSLSGYIGKLLKEKTSSKEAKDEMSANLSKALNLFKFISNKEYMEELHKRDLNRRLLQNRAYHIDMEMECVKMFLNITGDRLARHMETMIEDVSKSKAEMESFYNNGKDSEYVKNYIPNEGFNVNVLSEFAWPSITIENVKLSDEMEQVRASFHNHFISKPENKKKLIKWVPSRDICTISATFNSGRKELIMDLFQTAIVTRFNDIKDGETLTYKDLEIKTEMSKSTFDSALRSLVYGKAPILLRNGESGVSKPSQKFSDDDKFEVNLDLTDKNRRIQLTGYPRSKGTSSGGSASEQSKQQQHDRTLELMTVINQVMKIERTMEMKQLFLEVSKVAERRGLIELTDMKRPLEVLLDQNAIKRDDNNRDLFHYVL